MSGQHPESGSRPTPEQGSGTHTPVVPAPVTTPYAAGQPAPGWGVPTQAAADFGGPAAPGWGAPAGATRNASATKPWTLKRGAAVAGAAVALAAGAGVGVYALTSSSVATSGTAPGVVGGPGSGSQGSVPGMQGGPQGGSAGGGMFGQGGRDDFAAGGMGGVSAAVHSEYVVLQGSTYTTMAEQLGVVSEVSASSVTVKSSDGFTRSYALGSNLVVSNMEQRRQQAGGTGTQLGLSDIVAGGTVRIVATKSGSGYMASSVRLVEAAATGQSN